VNVLACLTCICFLNFCDFLVTNPFTICNDCKSLSPGSVSLFLLSNFMYFENAVPIRVKLVCELNFENWTEGTVDNVEEMLFNKQR
jgi:hypothetical protein